MELGDGLADCLAQDAEERRLRWVDGHHVQTLLPKRRRDFRADEPHADDDGPAAGDHLRADAIGVLTRAKTVNAFEIATRNRDKSIASARCDEQCVKRHAPMILELHDSRRPINSRRAYPEHRLDAVFREKCRRPHERIVKRHFATQVGFG